MNNRSDIERDTGVADEFAAVAVAQSSLTDATGIGRDLTGTAPQRSIGEWAERPIELLSRWAGILAFVGTVAVIAYLVL